MAPGDNPPLSSPPATALAAIIAAVDLVRVQRLCLAGRLITTQTLRWLDVCLRRLGNAHLAL